MRYSSGNTLQSSGNAFVQRAADQLQTRQRLATVATRRAIPADARFRQAKLRVSRW